MITVNGVCPFLPKCKHLKPKKGKGGGDFFYRKVF